MQRETEVRDSPNAQTLMLTTDRLILREFGDDDRQAVHSYASDPQVTCYVVWGPNTEQQTKEFIERMKCHARQTPRREHNLAVVLKEGNRLIGGCGLTLEGEDAKVGVLGYCYDRRHWGMGYATEAASCLLRFGFDTLGLRRIYSMADVRNTGSWRVMEKLGMQREGHLREHVLSKGQWRNTFLYGILEHEWRV